MKKSYSIFTNSIVLVILFGSFVTAGMPISQRMNSEATTLNDGLLLNNSDGDNDFQYIDTVYNQDSDFGIQSPRTGTQKFAVICMQFPDIGTTRWTTAGISGLMSWTNLYWQNASYQMIDIQWEVVGWYELSKNKADYGKLTDAFYEIMFEGVNAATNDIIIEDYDHVLVFINTDFCGISNVGKTTVLPWLDNHVVSFTMCGENDPDPVDDVWGRVAHEMGHAFGLHHTHGDGDYDGTKYYASYYSLMARGYPSALGTYSQLFDGKSGWFDTTTNEVVIDPGTANNYTLAPRYWDVSGLTQCLKVKVTDDYYYRIENIQQHGEDSWVPFEGVYIYEVDKGGHFTDECTDIDSTPGTANPDYYDCPWQVGDRFEDTDHNIVIEIKEAVDESFIVFVQNMAAGHVDLAISEWGDPAGNTPPYESADIWIDSPINGFGKLRYHDGNNNPVGNGDEPLVNHENRLYAMIHNIGDADAVDFDVKFYFNYPMGAGDDNIWALIDTKTIDLLPQGESLAVHVDWTPEVDISSGIDFTFKYHSCVKVEIICDEFEVTDGNNEAQENISFFEVTADKTEPNLKLPSTFFEPVTTTVKIRNPYPETKELYIGMQNMDGNWNVTGDYLYQWHNFTSHETKEIDITITPNDAIRFTETAQPSLYVAVIDDEVADATGFLPDSHMRTLPSMTFKVIAMYRSELELDAAVRTGNIELFGDLIYIDDVPIGDKPEEGDRNLLLEITNTDIQTTEFYVISYNSDGSFDYQYQVDIPGNYSITAYFSGTGVIAKSYSVTLTVDTISGEVGTSSNGAFIPGFDFLITLTVLVASTIALKIKRRKD